MILKFAILFILIVLAVELTHQDAKYRDLTKEEIKEMLDAVAIGDSCNCLYEVEYRRANGKFVDQRSRMIPITLAKLGDSTLYCDIDTTYTLVSRPSTRRKKSFDISQQITACYRVRCKY